MSVSIFYKLKSNNNTNNITKKKRKNNLQMEFTFLILTLNSRYYSFLLQLNILQSLKLHNLKNTYIVVIILRT